MSGCFRFLGDFLGDVRKGGLAGQAGATAVCRVNLLDIVPVRNVGGGRGSIAAHQNQSILFLKREKKKRKV